MKSIILNFHGRWGRILIATIVAALATALLPAPSLAQMRPPRVFNGPPIATPDNSSPAAKSDSGNKDGVVTSAGQLFV